MEPAECAFARVFIQGSPRIATGCSIGVAVLLAGCGETYRPVVTPVAVTGPAPQPQSYAVVTTSAGTSAPGLANVFDASGDTLLTQATLGDKPAGAHPQFQLPALPPPPIPTAPSTASRPRLRCETKNIQSSTLLQPAQPINLLSTATSLFITEPNVPAVAVLTNNSSGVYQLTQQLPVPASPINAGRQFQRCPRLLHHPGQRLQPGRFRRLRDSFAGHDSRPGAVDRNLDRDHLAHPAGWHLPRLWHWFY